jgi:hypothetical protein
VLAAVAAVGIPAQRAVWNRISRSFTARTVQRAEPLRNRVREQASSARGLTPGSRLIVRSGTPANRASGPVGFPTEVPQRNDVRARSVDGAARSFRDARSHPGTLVLLDLVDPGASGRDPLPACLADAYDLHEHEPDATQHPRHAPGTDHAGPSTATGPFRAMTDTGFAQSADDARGISGRDGVAGSSPASPMPGSTDTHGAVNDATAMAPVGTSSAPGRASSRATS